MQCRSVEDLYWNFLCKLSGKFSWQNLSERLLGKIPATELFAMSRYKISKGAVLARSPYKISARTSPCGYVTWETNSMKDPNHVLSPKRGRTVWTETSILMQQVRGKKSPGEAKKNSLAQSVPWKNPPRNSLPPIQAQRARTLLRRLRASLSLWVGQAGGGEHQTLGVKEHQTMMILRWLLNMAIYSWFTHRKMVVFHSCVKVYQRVTGVGIDVPTIGDLFWTSPRQVFVGIYIPFFVGWCETLGHLPTLAYTIRWLHSQARLPITMIFV